MGGNARLRGAILEFAARTQQSYPAAVKDLSGRVGIDHHYLYMLARGARRGSSRTQFALARTLGRTVDELFQPDEQNNGKW